MFDSSDGMRAILGPPYYVAVNHVYAVLPLAAHVYVVPVSEFPNVPSYPVLGRNTVRTQRSFYAQILRSK